MYFKKKTNTDIYVCNIRQHNIFAACRVPPKKKSNTDLLLYARDVSLSLGCPNLHFRFKLLAAPRLVAPSRSRARRVLSRASGGAAPPACSHPALPVPPHSHRGDRGGKGVARRAGGRARGVPICAGLFIRPPFARIGVAPRRRRRRLRDERACSR